MIVFLITIGFISLFFILMSVRLIFLKGGEFKGTCASQGNVCEVCGKKGECDKWLGVFVSVLFGRLVLKWFASYTITDEYDNYFFFIYYRSTQIPPLQTFMDNTSPLESISAILNGPVVVSVDTSEYAINPAPLIP